MKPTDADHIRLLERDIEEDNRILATKFGRIDGLPVLLESWSADGVRGMSAIFLTDQVDGLDVANLEKLLADHGAGLGGSGTTE